MELGPGRYPFCSVVRPLDGVDHSRVNYETNRHAEEDTEHLRQTLFASGNLTQPYRSINTDIHKRIRYLADETAPA